MLPPSPSSCCCCCCQPPAQQKRGGAHGWWFWPMPAALWEHACPGPGKAGQGHPSTLWQPLPRVQHPQEVSIVAPACLPAAHHPPTFWGAIRCQVGARLHRPQLAAQLLRLGRRLALHLLHLQPGIAGSLGMLLSQGCRAGGEAGSRAGEAEGRVQRRVMVMGVTGEQLQMAAGA